MELRLRFRLEGLRDPYRPVLHLRVYQDERLDMHLRTSCDLPCSYTHHRWTMVEGTSFTSGTTGIFGPSSWASLADGWGASPLQGEIVSHEVQSAFRRAVEQVSVMLVLNEADIEDKVSGLAMDFEVL